jgi:hypothetical protein
MNMSYRGKTNREIDYDLVTDESYLSMIVYVDEEDNGGGDARIASMRELACSLSLIFNNRGSMIMNGKQ